MNDVFEGVIAIEELMGKLNISDKNRGMSVTAPLNNGNISIASVMVSPQFALAKNIDGKLFARKSHHIHCTLFSEYMCILS